jgi:ABC-type xylose transport system substrate-binding protein
VDTTIVFAADTPAATISDRVRRGELVRLATGVYTSDVTSDPAEAEAAAALAIYLRAGVKPPASLLNLHVNDPQTSTSVASVLVTPEWVTTENMNSTVIADQFVSAARLCTDEYVSACAAAGIRS